MSLPVLRLATSLDIPRMSQIRLAVRENQLSNPGRITVADYEDYIAGRGRSWVLEHAGEIVGFSAADGESAMIWALFVDPSHAGRGHGRLLLAPAVAWLWDRGAASIRLTTAPGTRAERFYRAGGWQHTGTSPHGELEFTLPRPSTPPR